MKVTAVFDIGKTNKKFFLFDQQLREVFHRYQKLEETEDEDGFPCENVHELRRWVLDSFQKALSLKDVEIDSVNFSAYGASLVHLDEAGKISAPLYNYLKPFPEQCLRSFYKKYGDPMQLAAETASPSLGMLNSGLQLFWLKHDRPAVFRKIHRSLHLPQYLSYLLSGKACSEFTSIGCHTMLWAYGQRDYHRWVYAEGLDRLLPPIAASTLGMERRTDFQRVSKVGVGLHDSSAALLPYRLMSREPFLLLSTGTWSIALNPFNQEPLSPEELQQDCLNYLTPEGNPVKASRLFLGKEYQNWVQRLTDHFGLPADRHRTVEPDEALLRRLASIPGPVFTWEHLGGEPAAKGAADLSQFSGFDLAYHKLMQELTAVQVEQIRLALGKPGVDRIYIDGGFADNRLFIHFLQKALPNVRLVAAEAPFGSAIGAAVALQDRERAEELLREYFQGREIRATAAKTGRK